MNTTHVLNQIAEKFGCNVSVRDFIPCGTWRATEIGLARCKSEMLVATMRKIRDTAPRKKSRAVMRGIKAEVRTVVLMLLCADEKGSVTGTDEDAEKFLQKNHEPFARLIFMVTLAQLPSMLQKLGIDSTAQAHNNGGTR